MLVLCVYDSVPVLSSSSPSFDLNTDKKPSGYGTCRPKGLRGPILSVRLWLKHTTECGNCQIQLSSPIPPVLARAHRFPGGTL